MPTKQRKRSTDDILQLERYLELAHGIAQPAQELARPTSATLGSFANVNPGFIRWDSLVLPQKVKIRLNIMSQPSQDCRKQSFLNRVKEKWRSFLGGTRKEWLGSFALCRRQGRDFTLKLRTHYVALPRAQGFIDRKHIGPAFKALSEAVLATIRDFVWDTWSIFWILWRTFWPLLYYPICAFFAGWAVLQLLAMWYTYFSTLFYNSFCPYRFPFVRNYVCSTWDQLQSTPIRIPTMTNLDAPFENVLQTDGKTISYKLPYHLGCYQTKIRGFRASLPITEYSAIDQSYFRDRFSKLINATHPTIDESQDFHTYLVQTIDMHLAGTKVVVQRMENGGLLDRTRIVVHYENSWVQTVEWFNSWHLIYLPGGIAPIHRSMIQVGELDSVKLMKEHVEGIKGHLMKNIELAIGLKGSLSKIEQLSEEIWSRVSDVKARNTRDAHEKGNRFRIWITEWFYGQSYEHYQIDQREKWLDNMGVELEEAVEFLDVAQREFSDGRVACDVLIESLVAVEVRGKKEGIPDWVMQQAELLDTRLKKLEKKLDDFNLGQEKFKARVRRRELAGF